MKNLKKLASLMLALVLALSLATTAFAADDATGSITINHQDGTIAATYTYYQLLRASLSEEKDEDGNPVAASYYLLKADSALKAALETAGVFKFTESSDESRWIVVLTEDIEGKALAAALNTPAIKEAALSTGTFDMDDDGKATAGKLDVGYYLITSTLGSELVLQTLGHVEIVAKHEEITTEKTASETNMSVGDMVTYTITVAIPATANVDDVVTVYDTIDEDKLAIRGDVTAACDGNNVTLTDVANEEGETYTFKKTFVITEAMLGKDVVVTYSAELLSTAANEEGYVNDAFSTIPGYRTKPSTVKVWTFDFDLKKTFTGADQTKLDQYVAKFELYDEARNQISFVKDGTGYVKADSDDTNTITELEVNGADQINIRGLAAGTYYLKETETVDGYNLLTKDVIVTITDTSDEEAAVTGQKISHSVSYKIGEDGDENTGVVTVENNSGTELPETGGMGTTIFYGVGGVLVVCAVVLLVTKKRMNAKD